MIHNPVVDNRVRHETNISSLHDQQGPNSPPCLFIARAELSQKVMFLFYLQLGERGAPAGELGEGGGGVAGEGGWWGERPSAKSPAAGVVEGGGGLRIRSCWGWGGSMATGPRREGGGRNRPAVGGGVWADSEAARRSAAGRGGGHRRPGQVSGGGVAPGEGGDATSVSISGGGRRRQRRRSRSRRRQGTAGARRRELLRCIDGKLHKAINRHPAGQGAAMHFTAVHRHFPRHANAGRKPGTVGWAR